MKVCRCRSRGRCASSAVADNDGSLHRRLVDGCDEAGAELYRRHRRQVENACLAVLRDHSLAADTTQEVFLELLKRPEGFDAAKGTLVGYLRMMARRRSIDVIRSLERSRDREKCIIDHPRVAPAADAVVQRAALGSLVREAVARLPAKHQQVVDHAYYRCNTRRQTAVELAIPEGTVKTRLRVALRRLGADGALKAGV